MLNRNVLPFMRDNADQGYITVFSGSHSSSVMFMVCEK